MSGAGGAGNECNMYAQYLLLNRMLRTSRHAKALAFRTCDYVTNQLSTMFAVKTMI
jgi:hypothetical protein